MFPPVPAVDLPGILSVQPCEKCCCRHEKPCDPRRDIVEDIIHFRRNPSEIQVPVIFIAQHRVHGIHCLVQKSQGSSSDHHIDQRSGHPVRGILCHSLYRRLRDAFLSELLCIPAYDHGDCSPRPGKVALFQLLIYLPALR